LLFVDRADLLIFNWYYFAMIRFFSLFGEFEGFFFAMDFVTMATLLKYLGFFLF
jgi:hypothetical protein